MNSSAFIKAKEKAPATGREGVLTTAVVIGDKEYFKNNVVVSLANGLTRIYVRYGIDYEDIDHTPDFYPLSYDEFYFDTYAGFPLELPTSEEYADFMEDMTGHLYDIPQNVSEYAEWLIVNNPAYFVFNAVVNAYPYTPSLYAEVAAEAEIADLKADIEDLKKLPDFVKAIEAAQAEFEALVAENAAQLAADKAEVEAFYAKYLAAEEKATAELDAIKAKNDAIKSRLTAMNTVIKEYCTAKNNGTATATVDALVAALQTNYEAAVADVIAAEQAVINAEKTLEHLKAGVVSAAGAAQSAYDRAAEELAEAMAALDKATADLKAMLEIIYGEAEETPAE